MVGKFTRRQIECLELAMGGWTYKQIAGRLGLAEATIRRHMHSMFDASGCDDRLTLGMFALRNPSWFAPKGGTGLAQWMQQHSTANREAEERRMLGWLKRKYEA